MRVLHVVDPEDDKKTKCGEVRNPWTFPAEEMVATIREYLAVVVTGNVGMIGCDKCCSEEHHKTIGDWNEARDIERILAGKDDEEGVPAKVDNDYV